MGLVPSLSSLPRELSRAGLSITFTHQNVPPGLSHDLTLCLYRVVQEALQNAIRHSSAHNVSVNLRGDADTLMLTITDDGMGFDVDAEWGTGLGLLSMTERLESMNGGVTIHSRRGAGTRVEVSVPVPLVRETATAV
jgi:signal transduction histidine kinase